LSNGPLARVGNQDLAQVTSSGPRYPGETSHVAIQAFHFLLVTALLFFVALSLVSEVLSLATGNLVLFEVGLSPFAV
jgi:hypothetical protein